MFSDEDSKPAVCMDTSGTFSLLWPWIGEMTCAKVNVGSLHVPTTIVGRRHHIRAATIFITSTAFLPVTLGAALGRA